MVPEMLELIHFIKCQLTIVLNWIPLLKILFLVYLALPIYLLTNYKNTKPTVKLAFLSIALLTIWLLQTFLWNEIHKIYYNNIN